MVGCGWWQVKHDTMMVEGEYMLRAVVTGSGGVAVHVVAGHRSGALFALHSLHQLLEPATAAAAACVVLPGLPLTGAAFILQMCRRLAHEPDVWVART